MNTEKLKGLVNGWVRLAREDVRNKVVELMEGTETTAEQLAEALSIPLDELRCVLEGVNEISLTTFATLLTATGHVLSIETEEEAMRKQVIHTPMPPRGFIPHPPYHTDEASMEHGTRPPFGRRPMGEMPPYGRRSKPMNFEHREIPQRPYEAPHTPTSPFMNKSSEELQRIIKERLWDTEIDLPTASKEMMVRFLDEKNRRMSEVRRAKELEEDPKINAWKQRIQKTVNENPRLADWMHKYMGGLED